MPISRTPIEATPEKSQDHLVRKQDTISFSISEPKYTFDDIILTKDESSEVTRFLGLIKNEKTILDDWGLSNVIKHFNRNINLYGPSGTGKTLTAHAIASVLKKQIVSVNYSEIESKYVGETSKNLAKLFEFAAVNDAVILFDEADALLSRRVTAMYSASDVSVNQTRNVLLKILDEYSGIVIFTTNFYQNFDSAFLRRIFTHVRFDLPDYETRIKLWEHYIVDELPVKNREEIIKRIATFDNISGADIATAVLMAAVDVANSDEQSINYEMILHGLERINSSKEAMNDKFEISTRKVSEEYALRKIKGD